MIHLCQKGIILVMYHTYILTSLKNGHYYIGSCRDLQTRTARHNKGLVKSTKTGCPWKVVYSEKYNDRSEAFKREKQIKSYKGGEAFKKLID